MEKKQLIDNKTKEPIAPVTHVKAVITDTGESIENYLVGQKDTSPGAEGEIFNDYQNNKAIGKYSHAEGSGDPKKESATLNIVSSEVVGKNQNQHSLFVITLPLALCNIVDSHILDISISNLIFKPNSVFSLKDIIYNTYDIVSEDVTSDPQNLTIKVIEKTAIPTGEQTITLIESGALGIASHTEGGRTLASGLASHAEGFKSKVLYKNNTGDPIGAHAEGTNCIAQGKGSHAEGGGTNAVGKYSHSEGDGTVASAWGTHAEGYDTGAFGENSHAEGFGTTASDEASHAEGEYTTASGYSSHAEGSNTLAKGIASHTEGSDTKASGDYGSHAEGFGTTASGEASHAEGFGTTASGNNSHAEGAYTMASRLASHAEGSHTEASGGNSHAEGSQTMATGDYSHAEGYGTKATSNLSHAEGYHTTASQYGSHAEGSFTTASDSNSHAEGSSTTASGSESHAEGDSTTASGDDSHAEGWATKTFSSYSHAEGCKTIASNIAEHAEGLCNKSNKNVAGGNTISSIGIGTYFPEVRKNAVEVLDNGLMFVYGIGTYDGTNPLETNSLQAILAAKADKTEIPNITGKLDTSVYTEDKKTFALKSELPTKVSLLTNDSGFLTSHQDITGKLDTSVYEIDKPTFAKKILVESSIGVTTKALDPNKFYNLGECSTITITLNPGNSNEYNEYMFQFKALSTDLILPPEVRWINDELPVFVNGMTYQVSILNNMAVCGGSLI